MLGAHRWLPTDLEIESQVLKVLLSLVGPRASQVVLVVKNLPAITGDIRDTGPIPGSGRSPGERNGNPLQYSCWKNPMDRGALCAKVHGGHKELDMIEHLSHIRPNPAASAALSILRASLP